MSQEVWNYCRNWQRSKQQYSFKPQYCAELWHPPWLSLPFFHVVWNPQNNLYKVSDAEFPANVRNILGRKTSILRLQFRAPKEKSKSRAPALYLPFCVLWSKVMKRKLTEKVNLPTVTSADQNIKPQAMVYVSSLQVCVGCSQKKEKTKQQLRGTPEFKLRQRTRPSSLITEIIKAVPLTNIWLLNGYLFCRNTLAARLIHNLKVKISLEQFLRLISGGRRQNCLCTQIGWTHGANQRIEPCDVTLTRCLSPLGQKDFHSPLWLLFQKLCVFKGAQNRRWCWPKQSVHIDDGDLDCLKQWLFGVPPPVIA